MKGDRQTDTVPAENRGMRGAQRKMNSLPESVKYTYKDLLAFPDDGKRREIIGGELYVSPSPAPPHQIVVGNLHFEIRTYLVAHPVGRIFLSPLDVVFSKFDVVEPDLLFISNARQDQGCGSTRSASLPTCRLHRRMGLC